MNGRSNWMRDRRVELGIRTQDELTRLLQLEGVSVTRAAVSHWESGRNPPPVYDPEFRKVIGRVLKLSESEILRLAGVTVLSHYSDEAERAAALIDQMDTDMRRKAVKLIEALL